MTEASRFVGGTIYAFGDPIGGSIRYVGKTSRTARARLRQHQKLAKTGSDVPLHRWLREIGVEPSVIILETEPSDRDEAERQWIERLRSSGADLLNLQDGGTGWTKGLPQSDEGNRKRSETAKSHPQTTAQLDGLVKATEAARAPDVRARAGRAISLARKGKRYVENPHGTRKRYRQGCTCDLCRAGNSAYQRERSAAKRRPASPSD